MMIDKIYNIPATKSFLDEIARLFLDEYKDKLLDLADVIFLLPNRRACKSLTDAFVRLQGLKPTMLPQMKPLADADEEELLITGFDLSDELHRLSPIMSTSERLMLFTKIIMAKPTDYGLEKIPAGQAVSLAKELASLIDLAYNQQLSFDDLQNIVPVEYAEHWQETLKFLQIITKFWPDILQEQGKVDAVEYKNKLLKAQIELWKKLKSSKKIVVAGTTAVFPLMKELVKTVTELDNGLVILSGLDKNLSDDDWAEIDEVHPQYELKELLEYLQINRFEIKNLVDAKNKDREYFITEIMRPAKTSDKWRCLNSNIITTKSIEGIKVINTQDVRVEALAIALLMREVLSVPEKTAALVTTDRLLARRVAAELKRWDIEVDDSAGKPLYLTPVGIFLRQILNVIEQNFSPVAVLALMKYPLFANGCTYFDIRSKVRAFEKNYLRSKKENGEFNDIVTELKSIMLPLCNLYQNNSCSLEELIKTHLHIAEVLASTNVKTGDKILWKGDDGEIAARFMADVLEKANILGEINPYEYAGWLDALMSTMTVRNTYGAHPRLKILGPIEARLMQFDRVIIGEVNETSWPQAPKADPWLSRPMKKDFGLPLPEKNIGVLANDFASLLSSEEVFVTRADRVQGTPMVKSRWLMRLETVLKALGINCDSLNADEYIRWAEFLDKAEVLKRILPPAPTPPVSARPRKLSASAIENLMRDPYIIYAKYILGLRKLDDLEQDLKFSDYGNIVHAVLEEFNNKYSSTYPDNAKEELIQLGEYAFARNQISADVKAFWWPNFLKTVEWLVNKESDYRKEIKKVYNEVTGEYSFEAPAGNFVVTAKADRVDITNDNMVNIIDYKTGQIRKNKEIELSYAPQLPIEALIASTGGFKDIPALEVGALMYWQLGKKESGVTDNIKEILDNTYDRIVELISLFDFETTPYNSKPNPKIAPKYSDYEHLSRMNEIMFADED